MLLNWDYNKFQVVFSLHTNVINKLNFFYENEKKKITLKIKKCKLKKNLFSIMCALK